ncbi:hypothetical protein AHiyo4_02700 [Arthrobacter sp. Hiyo4]|nr:hypothetical protein AHiyo4_02700 [Arthrobacter sp. Hiyo4]
MVKDGFGPPGQWTSFSRYQPCGRSRLNLSATIRSSTAPASHGFVARSA